MKLFDKYKNASTDGNPDIFWPWVMESATIIMLTLGLAYVIFKYLKFKGII